MGAALYNGWQSANLNATFTIISPNSKPAPADNTTYYSAAEDAAEALSQATIIIMAVKPQVMEQVCAHLKPYVSDQALIVSIAVGQPLSNFATYFSPAQPIIRIMPNTPVAIGKGTSICVASPSCTDTHKASIDALLAPSGQNHWLEDETLMNAAGAISGSGPAYLFYFIEALTAAAQNAGLPKDMAESLARQTIIGSAHLAEQDATTPAATLRENVTSPGGTTQAALSRLMDGEFQTILNQAIEKAVKRSAEL